MKIAKTVLTALVAATVSLSVNANTQTADEIAAQYAAQAQSAQTTTIQQKVLGTEHVPTPHELDQQEQAAHDQRIKAFLVERCRPFGFQVEAVVLDVQNFAATERNKHMQDSYNAEQLIRDAAVEDFMRAQNSKRVSIRSDRLFAGESTTNYAARQIQSVAIGQIRSSNRELDAQSENMYQFRSTEVAEIAGKLKVNELKIGNAFKRIAHLIDESPSQAATYCSDLANLRVQY